jgi:hypothetical protein
MSKLTGALLLLLLPSCVCPGAVGASSRAAVYSGPAAACTSGTGKYLQDMQQQQQQGQYTTCSMSSLWCSSRQLVTQEQEHSNAW